MSKHKPSRDDSRRAQLRAAQLREAKQKQARRIAMGVVGAVLAIALIVVIFLFYNKTRQVDLANTPPNSNGQRDGILVNPGKGKPGAPVVALYADYQCPACSSFEKAYGPVLEEMANAGDIQLEYHIMTFLDANLRNDASERAANASMCADLVGHYGAYHNAVFTNQPADEGQGYTDDQLTKQFTAQAGISGDALNSFNQCYTEKRYSNFVKQLDNKAAQAGITGTPSIKVNGKDLSLKDLTNDPQSLRTEIMKLK